MTLETTPTILMVPGLRDHVAEHWQTLLESRLPKAASVPPCEHGWTPIPRKPLPFPSIVGASRNDPLAQFERVEVMAKVWGRSLVDLGEVGHLNPAAGFGEWPMAESLIRELL